MYEHLPSIFNSSFSFFGGVVWGGGGGGGGRRASILGSQQGRKMIENDVNVCKLISSLLSDFCCI